ncbi:MAG TPA: hypothetical protein VMO17_21875 [Terriglobia bacterium]|nr:hypothetical protein [Terriglobia bacterium]
MPLTRAKLLRYLVAILLGNALYFALSPYLPPAAQHHSTAIDLGTIVDFWICLAVYGLMRLGASARRGEGERNKPQG